MGALSVEWGIADHVADGDVGKPGAAADEFGSASAQGHSHSAYNAGPEEFGSRHRRFVRQKRQDGRHADGDGAAVTRRRGSFACTNAEREEIFEFRMRYGMTEADFWAEAATCYMETADLVEQCR